jgi:prepilin-type N-terminal cleavage/methylation domain-containing protein/prepilin-type processing-associated H-X9-DG protein
MPDRHRSSHRTLGNCRRAFTLVELLIVVAIITVLISLLIPVISKVREQSTRVRCTANLRAIQTGMYSYAIANNNWYPLPAPSNGADGGDTINWVDGEENQACFKRTVGPLPQKGGIGWLIGRQASISPKSYSGNGQQPYVTDWRVFYCPTAQKRKLDTAAGIWWTTDDKSNGNATTPLPIPKAGTNRSSNYVQWNPWAGDANYSEYVAKRMTDSPRYLLTGDRLAWQALGTQKWKLNERTRLLDLYTNHPTGANFVFNDGHVAFYAVNPGNDKTGFYVTGRSNVSNTQQWYAMPDIKKNY